ncbi:hypothetical protein AALB16_13475 [Lachnospiraceae bacterium 62-35]
MMKIKREMDYGTGKICVILQFPEEPNNVNLIQKEVNGILNNELHKQMKKYERNNQFTLFPTGKN